MKKITIENLLIWAFTQELPKVGAGGGNGPSAAASSWEALSEMIALGTLIDKSPNGYGVIASYIQEGEPHVDAVTVGNAVRALVEHDGFEIAAGWNPFPEWQDDHGLIAEAVAHVASSEVGRKGRLNGKQIVSLVTSAAILRRGPDWHADEPKAVMVLWSGKPAWFIRKKIQDRTGWHEVEDDGFDKKRQRPLKGAYRKFKLATPIRSAIIARMEWQLWQSALEALFDSLAGRLKEHEILPFTPNRHPWATLSKSADFPQEIEKVA
jgi:hypothetical protein